MNSDDRLPEAKRFDGLAEVYDRYRPSYPAEAIAAVLAGLPTPPDVLDVGAGTGISSRALAAAGANVIAIEPNADMRSIACAQGVDARDATAFATGRPPESFDLVTAFQAFHWFAQPRALAEFVRVLRPGGRLAIVWNERDRDDAFSSEIREAEVKYCDPTEIAGADFADDTTEPLIRDAGFERFRVSYFSNEQRFDEAGLMGRMRSKSYLPRDPRAREALFDAVRAAYERHRDESGSVVLKLNTEVYLAELKA